MLAQLFFRKLSFSLDDSQRGFWLGYMNYVLCGEFLSLPRLMIKMFLQTHYFAQPELIFPLVNMLSFILFRLLEINFCWPPKFSFDAEMFRYSYCSLCESKKNFSLNENVFPSYRIHQHWSLTFSKLCIAMRRKELVKVFSPPLQFTFNKKEKTKSFKKVKLDVYLRMLVR